MTPQEAIETRRAVKHFDPDHRMTEEEIARLIELAKLAPSSFNMQNYRFVLVRDPELRKEIRAVAWNQAQVTDASLLVILCADPPPMRRIPRAIGRTPRRKCRTSLSPRSLPSTKAMRDSSATKACVRPVSRA
jgi:nitroreductase